MIYNKVRFGVFLFLLISIVQSYGSDTLSLENYLEVVLDYHPLIQKADINEEIAEAYILKGKGALDPKAYSDFDRKRFDGTDYFTVWQSEVKIPTKLPIDFSLGYENNDGVFLNNENSVPDNGLIYGTLNLSILRGLLFDEQRYNLQYGELQGLKSRIEREILVREIIYQATESYLAWASKNNTVEINEEYLLLISERHQNVIQLFINGDSPVVDTIESRLNLNSAEKLLLESRSKLIKSKQNLSLFIWDEDGQPLQVNSNIVPMSLQSLVSKLRELSILISPDFNSDPLIAKVDNAIEAIELDTRLEKENLKPQLDLKYNTILNLGKTEFDPSFAINDYKYGVSFQYPLLNRKTRGQLRINQSMTRQSELDKVEYLGQLNNKFDGLLIQQEVQEDLVTVSNEKLRNSQLLYEAETLKFSLGESSVFLLNKRELKLLESQLDLIKSYQSLCKTFSELYYLKMGQE